MDLRKKGRLFIGPLAEELNCPVYLSAPWRGHSIIIDVVYPASCSVDVGLVIGMPHVINHSACGKICAAFASLDELEVLKQEMAGVESTAAVKAFLTELEPIRKNRFAIRCENGHNAAAVPVFRSGEVFCGALGANRENCWNSLKKHADALSFALGRPFSS
jgi:DNA-binding IclR family transcriptional regulator